MSIECDLMKKNLRLLAFLLKLLLTLLKILRYRAFRGLGLNLCHLFHFFLSFFQVCLNLCLDLFDMLDIILYVDFVIKHRFCRIFSLNNFQVLCLNIWLYYLDPRGNPCEPAHFPTISCFRLLPQHMHGNLRVPIVSLDLFDDLLGFLDIWLRPLLLAEGLLWGLINDGVRNNRGLLDLLGFLNVLLALLRYTGCCGKGPFEWLFGWK